MWSFAESIVPVVVEFAWQVSTRLSGEETLSPRHEVKEVKVESPKSLLPSIESKALPVLEQKDQQALPTPVEKKSEDLWTRVDGLCYNKNPEKGELKREDAIAIIIDNESKEAKERALQIRKELKKNLPILISGKGPLQVCDTEELKYEATLSQLKPKLVKALQQDARSFSLFKKSLERFEELPWVLTIKRAREVLAIIERAQKQQISWQKAWWEVELRCSPQEKARRKELR